MPFRNRPTPESYRPQLSKLVIVTERPSNVQGYILRLTTTKIILGQDSSDLQWAIDDVMNTLDDPGVQTIVFVVPAAVTKYVVETLTAYSAAQIETTDRDQEGENSSHE